MQGIVNNTPVVGSAAAEPSEPRPDPREAKYQLAERLVDNICFGEAIRILESLGDYGNSRALLEQVRTYQAYQEEAEAKLQAERRQQAHDRAMKEAEANRRRRVYCVLAATVCLIFFLILAWRA